jgi:hypothetical protein
MMPSTVVIPRVGSFALASFGRIRKVHELPFEGSAGRKSLALKRIFEVVLVIDATDLTRAYVRWVRNIQDEEVLRSRRILQCGIQGPRQKAGCPFNGRKQTVRHCLPGDRCWPIGLIQTPGSPSPALVFTTARMISAASYTLASARPQATSTTELDDIGDAVVGFRTETPQTEE